MAEIEANGVRLHYELSGQGDGIVLVHGSWADHDDWDLMARFRRRFRQRWSHPSKTAPIPSRSLRAN